MTAAFTEMNLHRNQIVPRDDSIQAAIRKQTLDLVEQVLTMAGTKISQKNWTCHINPSHQTKASNREIIIMAIPYSRGKSSRLSVFFSFGSTPNTNPTIAPNIAPDQGLARVPQVLPAHCPR
jgi:hypothetical protein